MFQNLNISKNSLLRLFFFFCPVLRPQGVMRNHFQPWGPISNDQYCLCFLKAYPMAAANLFLYFSFPASTCASLLLYFLTPFYAPLVRLVLFQLSKILHWGVAGLWHSLCSVTSSCFSFSIVHLSLPSCFYPLP